MQDSPLQIGTLDPDTGALINDTNSTNNDNNNNNNNINHDTTDNDNNDNENNNETNNNNIMCIYIYIYIYRGGGLRSRAVSGIAKGTMASLGVFERVTCILGDFTPSKRYPARVEPMIMQDLSKRNGRREIGRGPESS